MEERSAIDASVSFYGPSADGQLEPVKHNSQDIIQTTLNLRLSGANASP